MGRDETYAQARVLTLRWLDSIAVALADPEENDIDPQGHSEILRDLIGGVTKTAPEETAISTCRSESQ